MINLSTDHTFLAFIFRFRDSFSNGFLVRESPLGNGLRCNLMLPTAMYVLMYERGSLLTKRLDWVLRHFFVHRILFGTNYRSSSLMGKFGNTVYKRGSLQLFSKTVCIQRIFEKPVTPNKIRWRTAQLYYFYIFCVPKILKWQTMKEL